MPTWKQIAHFDEIPLAANPTGTIAGAAANGSAATWMRSDAAPALGPLTRDLAYGNFKGTGLGAPTAAADAATKGYVDGVAQGLSPKTSVVAATTAAGTLATSFANAQVIDGVTLATGDRILIKNQAAGAENGVYTVNASGVPTRALDADTAAEVLGAYVFVQEGTVNADTGWVMTTNTPITLNTTALVWAQFSNAGQYTGGNGLTLTGLDFAVNVDGTTIEISTDALRVKALGITDAHVATANKDGAAGTASMRTLGTGAAQAASGTDARFTNARQPSATAGGTAFDLGAFTNPLIGLTLASYVTGSRPAAVAGGLIRDSTLDRMMFATSA